MENVIDKPSEFDAAFSIPIGLIKAILSKPSALFNINVNRKYQGQIAELNKFIQLQILQNKVKVNTKVSDLKQVIKS